MNTQDIDTVISVVKGAAVIAVIAAVAPVIPVLMVWGAVGVGLTFGIWANAKINN